MKEIVVAEEVKEERIEVKEERIEVKEEEMAAKEELDARNLEDCESISGECGIAVEGKTPEQFLEALMIKAHDNPELLGNLAILLVRDALMEDYPEVAARVERELMEQKQQETGKETQLDTERTQQPLMDGNEEKGTPITSIAEETTDKSKAAPETDKGEAKENVKEEAKKWAASLLQTPPSGSKNTPPDKPSSPSGKGNGWSR